MAEAVAARQCAGDKPRISSTLEDESADFDAAGLNINFMTSAR